MFRNQSLSINMGNGDGGGFFLGGVTWFSRERVGDRSLPKEYKGGAFLELTDH